MRRAFTLVEAIATIAVLLLVSAIAAPNLSQVRAGQRRRAVIAALERLPLTAKVRARERGEPVSLRIEDGSAVLIAGSGTDTESEIGRVDFQGLITVETVATEDASETDAGWEWTVQPDGTAPMREATLDDGSTAWTARFEPDARLRWIGSGDDSTSEDSWAAGERVDRVQ
ncbi:MAG: Tfp pilus assembly protein FimT/FimU [Armatimonadota bacterium]